VQSFFFCSEQICGEAGRRAVGGMTKEGNVRVGQALPDITNGKTEQHQHSNCSNATQRINPCSTLCESRTPVANSDDDWRWLHWSTVLRMCIAETS
jgi:hypothetical protein